MDMTDNCFADYGNNIFIGLPYLCQVYNMLSIQINTFKGKWKNVCISIRLFYKLSHCIKNVYFDQSERSMMQDIQLCVTFFPPLQAH